MGEEHRWSSSSHKKRDLSAAAATFGVRRCGALSFGHRRRHCLVLEDKGVLAGGVTLLAVAQEGGVTSLVEAGGGSAEEVLRGETQEASRA